MKFAIIKRSRLRVSIGLVRMALCAILFFSNLRLSKQFTGGIEFKITGINAVQAEQEIKQLLSDSNLRITSNIAGDITNILVQQNQENEGQLLEHGKKIQAKYAGRLTEFAIVGPSIGKQVSNTALQAVIRGLVLMTVFIVFEFSKIRKFIQPATLAIITVATMLFDILSPMGVYGLYMLFNSTAQVDVIFIIALLTTMGYSINDTIIIFDRIREHLETDKGSDVATIFEKSLWETMTRSLMTSVSTLLVVIAMYILGTGDLKNFAFTMAIGVISGSYSSIFMAGPIAYLVTKRNSAKKKK